MALQAILSQSPSTLGLGLLVGVCIVCLTYTILYNVLLSPLRRIPGPISSRLSGLPLGFAQLKERRAQWLLQQHKQQGPIIRVSPNEVSIASHKHYRTIYGNNKACHKLPAFYHAATFVGKPNIFQMTNKEQHAARRKLSATPYSWQAVQQLEPLIKSKAAALGDRLLNGSLRSASGAVDAYELCAVYSFEVVCAAGFAKDFYGGVGDDALALLKAMDGSSGTFITQALMPWLGSSGIGLKLPGPIGDAYRSHRYWQIASREMVRHYQDKGKNDDAYLLAPYMNGIDGFLGRKLNHEEFVEEAMGIMFAGSGTTSTTLTYLLFAISRPGCEPVQQRLREELQSCSESLVELKGLPYLNAVIKETLRLFPTIISTLPCVLDEPFEIEEHILPPGTVVGMQNYVHHRDPEVFHDAEAFQPERWLDSTEDMEACLTPFSLGRRNCIGQNLAWAELYLAVSKVVRNTQLKLAPVMRQEDMNMDDRFNNSPRGRKLLLEVRPVTA